MNLEKLVEHLEDLLSAAFESGYAEGYTNGTEDAEYTAQVERNNEY